MVVVSIPRPLAESSCLGMSTDPEMDTEIGQPGGASVYASVAKVGASSILSGEILKSTKLFQ